MQDLTPDMEDLLRKASEAYPLKPTDDRWEEIASKLTAAPAPHAESKKKSGYKKYGMFFLLLFLFLFISDLLFNHFNNIESGKKQVHSSNEAKDGSPVKPFQPGVNNLLNKNTAQPTARRRQINDNPANPETGDPNGSVNLSGPGNKERFTYPNSITNEEETKMLYPERKKIIHPERNNFFKKESGLIPDTFSFRLYDQLISFLQTSKQRSSKTLSRKGFYYGVLAGAELNRVKNQHLKKTGWNLGLLAGYSFLKKFSVETGLLVSQKYYTTSGNYFSMKEIGATMPPPMKIMEVEGSSKLIEIPLVLRYYAIQNFQRTFFASAGFSSYILTKENNQFG